MTATNHYDVIVLGVGGMGSATLYHLARRGRRVLGLEQFTIPNQLGSSHGTTRIIRLAYFTKPFYVPLLRRAYDLWRELEAESRQSLMHITGSVYAGPAGHFVVQGALDSCREFGLPHEVLSAEELHKRFPGYQLPVDQLALFQPDGGFLMSEKCIEAHVDVGVEAGAHVRTNEKVVGWRARPDEVTVRTRNATYSARELVITAGAWSGKLMHSLGRVLTPERQVLAWFEPSRPELFTPDRFPVFIIADDETRFYGFPVIAGDGLKLGRYRHFREAVDPDSMDRAVHKNDEALLRRCVERNFPEANGRMLAATTCMFTNSPDSDFIIDTHPEHDNVHVAAGFSGHGYKFCSVVGEIMADLATSRTTSHEISMFRMKRFETVIA